MDTPEYINISCHIFQETYGAIKIEATVMGKSVTCWVPKSQLAIIPDEIPLLNTSIAIPEWLAIEKGLV